MKAFPSPPGFSLHETRKIQRCWQRGLFAITWPIFIEQLSHILPGIVDTFMVSHLGDNAVAGLAVANQIVGFFIILFSFIGIGSTVVLTHFLGRDP
ncbi:hypothetical protein LP419_00045 [Massilia sp. H-1]|nr:hypothetical protein LP419_00045 [Massilia sp. H-1]